MNGEFLARDGKSYKRLQEEGKFLVTLKFRVWGKSMNLGCYFQTDEGSRFYLYAWRIKGGVRDEQYCPRDSEPNFAEVEDDTRWLIETKKSRNGNIYWSTAERQ